MTHADYNNLALEQFADLMIEKMLEMKNADWKKPWFTEGALLIPVNIRGTKYYGINEITLMLQQDKQQYELSVWATFNQFASLNEDGKEQVSIKKGEKLFPVYHTSFIVINRETGEKITFEQYRTLSADEQKDYITLPKSNVYRVFNVAQTNLKEARPDVYEKLKRKYGQETREIKSYDTLSIPGIDRMLEEQAWVCPIHQKKQDSAFYSIGNDSITVPMMKQFKDNESFYGTLLHEMAHSTGAKNRLERFGSENFGSESYLMEELIAELSSAFTLSRLGFVKYIKEDSATYLNSWCKFLKETPNAIKKVLGEVRKASKMIGEHIGISEEYAPKMKTAV